MFSVNFFCPFFLHLSYFQSLLSRKTLNCVVLRVATTAHKSGKNIFKKKKIADCCMHFKKHIVSVVPNYSRTQIKRLVET